MPVTIWRPDAAGTTIRTMTGFPAALAATLIIAVLAWNALRQVRTGRWTSWRRSSINPGLVRVSGAFGLAFCAAALFAVWWSTLAQPR
jgi:hypothetical protein